MQFDLTRRLAAEALGTLILVMSVIGSGIMAEKLAGGNQAIALLCTGAVVGILSGASPLKRALRQLGIGYGAAAATYLLGRAFGASLS